MKLRLLFLLLCFGTWVFGQKTHIGKQAYAIHKLVQKEHYDPKPLDDSLSAYVFDTFIDNIDPSGFYFRISDIHRLEQYRFEIDDQMRNETSEFFDVATRLYEQRLKTADSLVTEVLKTPFDFKKDEVLSYLPEDYKPYVLDTRSLQERWRKWLKYSVLEEIFEGDYIENEDEQSIEDLLKFVPEALEAVEAAERFEISSYLEHPAGFRNYMATFYLEALASYYDPHTTYFSEIDQQNFEEELSKDKKAYGFSMNQNAAGQVLIAGLIPGSAAWMSGQMSVGDQIIEVKFEGGKKLDVVRMDANSLSLEFENATAQSMVMKLKKPNGNIEEVHLTKAEIYVDQDVIKSVILDGEKKVGYIILPDFYTDWDNYNGLGCANDVAKNLVKLKQENIDGLILDLRNNGGGSLKEAMDLAGIFINYGPITIEADKYSEGKTLKDMNRGAIYTGPLVILVNGLSASASEIFSAAMQDYNRAIIVGSQTYGKSTGQVILPLDPSGGVDPSTELGMGYLKVTTSKFYRVNKTTHQKEGLKPDIMLRDYYELYDYAEANYPNAIGNDNIEKKIYFTPAAPINKSSLKSQSETRMNQNQNYQKLCEMIDTIDAFKAYYQEVPLNIEAYRAHEKRMNDYYSTLWDSEESKAEQFEVINNKYDLEIMKINDFRSKLNDEYLENVAKDLYIGEAYNIILDYIKSK